ncbi:MAG: sigma-54-dependent Fis family transcriptional regulator [Desulfobacteraceae bacterium]|nr:sigma-54-dependent Fis family transcriptional regulator [Desulfobacteraceae bacterium]
MKKDLTILIVDDDHYFTGSLSEFLSGKGYTILTVGTARDGIKSFEEHIPPIVLLDQELPDSSGLEVCRKILEIESSVKIIFITAHASVRYAVDAMQAGAFNYLAKPFSLDELMIAINLAVKNVQLEDQLKIQAYEQKHAHSGHRLLGVSDAMERLREQIKIGSESQAVILITGETGVGKNLVAREIHDLQEKRDSFLSINCSAIPENLIEAEYFGHEKGVFTGADARREGIFELANGGTLVLDEISEVPFHLQSKLLAVLEERQVRRIGSARPINVDVRIIAISNQNLESAIRENRFREDLYYRLAVINIQVPALRHHIEDLPILAGFFVQRFCGKEAGISDDQIKQMQKYAWPGNVRELRNIIERASLLRRGNQIKPADLLVPGHLNTRLVQNTEAAPVAHQTKIVTLDELTNRHITSTLAVFAGNKSKTAKELGISLSTLKRKLKK